MQRRLTTPSASSRWPTSSAPRVSRSPAGSSGQRTLGGRTAAAERVLVPIARPLTEGAALARDLCERMAIDRSLLRAEDGAAALGVGLRTLERLFARHVGVSPKWVIRRYRLREAAEQLRSTPGIALAGLAASLGYADQAHFARDFKAVIGLSPRAFAARVER